MPSENTHKYVGLVVGAAYAGHRAKAQSGPNWWAEVAGGAVGGYLGGRLPDILEPALSSWHRGVAHSCSAGGAIIVVKDPFTLWETACRENAEKCKAIPMAPHGGMFVPVPIDLFSQMFLKLAELWWRFLAGFLNGLAAGYVSHLALDAATPRSIPLLTAAF